MTQQATVRRVLANGLAEVEVVRRGACSHDCAKCGGCGVEVQTLLVTARNEAGASVGDRVTIEGENKTVLGLAALVYTLPLVLFFLGYGLAALTAAGAVFSTICGVVGFMAGVFAAVLQSRRMKQRNEIPFAITQRV